MNSVVCVFAVISVITANGERPGLIYPSKKIIRTPFCFGYSYRDSLNIRIHFYNLSPAVIYTIYEAEFESSVKPKLKYDILRREDHYIIQKRTPKLRILIFIEIKTNDRLCSNITIIDAKNLDKMDDKGYVYNKACLILSQPCVIDMDLSKFCSGFPYVTSTKKTIMKETTAMPVIDEENLNSKTSLTSNVVTSPQYGSIETTTSVMTASTKEADKLTKSTQSNVFIYVIPSVIVMFVLILVIYISIKKYCHRNLYPVETMELNTYTTANQVVYADLSLLHGDNQPPKRDEDSPYAQIIGVMKPVDEMYKKNKLS